MRTAAPLPLDALRKGTETLQETSRKVLTMKCTARQKSKFCKGYCHPSQLMPCQLKDANDQPCGIEDMCVHCYNGKNGADYTDNASVLIAKEVCYRRFNRTMSPKDFRGN